MGLPKNDFVGITNGRWDFVVCAEVVEVTERKEVIERDKVVERFEVETEVRTVHSTMSVLSDRSFSLYVERGVVASFIFRELVEALVVVGAACGRSVRVKAVRVDHLVELFR